MICGRIKLRLSVLVLIMAAAFVAASEMRDIAKLLTFEKEKTGELAPFRYWRWSKADQQRPELFSSQSLLNDSAEGTVWRFEIKPDFPWDDNPVRFRIVTTSHFPPEADAVIIRLKVLKGEMRLGIGSPTAYFGDSDVMTSPQTFTPGEWQDAVFDLNDGLCRNFRRAGLGRFAKAIAYNRWSQEAPGLYLLPTPGFEVLVKEIRLAASGKGRPFPEFRADEVQEIAAIPCSLDNSFTLLTPESKDQVADFERSWREPEKCRYRAPVVASGVSGTSVGATVHWAEEIRWFGLRCLPSEQANAIQLRIKLTTGLKSSLAGAGAEHPIDIALFAGEGGFPFARFAAPEAWRGGPVRGYDYCYNFNALLSEMSLDSAIYQSRRFLKAGEWTLLTVPLADFACFAATGKSRTELESRLSPESAKDISGIAVLLPFNRRGKSEESTIEIGGAALVRVPGRPEELRSYPPPRAGELIKIDGMKAYGGWVQSQSPKSQVDK